MEPQSYSPVTKSNKISFGSFTFFLIIAVSIMFGVVIGIGVMRQTVENVSISKSSSSSVSSVPAIKENLPISRELLNNKMVTQWRGSFEGQLISKSESLYVIQDEKGNKLNLLTTTATGEKWNVIFIDGRDESRRIISYEEVPINVKILGDFWILPGGESSPIAGMLTLIR